MKEIDSSINKFDEDEHFIKETEREDGVLSTFINMIGIFAAIFALIVFWCFIGIAAFFAGGWPFPPMTCVIVTFTTSSAIGFGVWLCFK